MERLLREIGKGVCAVDLLHIAAIDADLRQINGCIGGRRRGVAKLGVPLESWRRMLSPTPN
jgi:hypothetical protein